MPINTIRDLVKQAEDYPQSINAFILKDELNDCQISYANLLKSVYKLASSLLNYGIKKGEKIGIMAENRVEWTVVYLSVTSLGGIIVPISILWEPPEIDNVLKNSGMRLIFTSSRYLEKINKAYNEDSLLEEIITFDETDTDTNYNCTVLSYSSLMASNLEIKEIDSHIFDSIELAPSDTVEILFVSTSIGVELSHHALISNMKGILDTFDLSSEQGGMGKKMLMIIPFSHLYPTVFGILMVLMANWTLVTTSAARMDFILRIIKGEEPDYIILVPLLLERMVNRLEARLKKRSGGLAEIGFGNTKFIFTAGVKCPENTIVKMEDMGIPVLEGYGLSEMAPFISVSSPAFHRPGSAGIRLVNVEVKIDAEDEMGVGEILARGPNLMSGYFGLTKNPADLTDKGYVFMDKDGWLHTGDLGLIDKDGFLYIKGRKRDIIVTRGGTNIYPREIEQKLMECPYIKQVKIIKKYDEVFGEAPFAIIYAENIEGVDIEKAIGLELENLGGKIASYKLPKGFELILDNNK